MTAAPLLRIRGLAAGYSGVPVLRGVDVDVPAGGFVSVIGPNGAGKSTLVKALYGLAQVTAGRVVLTRDDGEADLVGRRPHELTAMGLNYVPQVANVFPSMTIAENLAVGVRTRRHDRARLLAQAYDTFPLLAARRGQRAGTLSGGQRQLLALARGLVTEPRLLLLDEPSAGLAPQVVDDLFDRLAAIHAHGVALLVVEQNARRALALSQYAYVLDMGANAHEGPGPALLDDQRVVDLYLGGGAQA